MDNTNTSTKKISMGAPRFDGNDRSEPAAASIRYVGRKEAKVPLPVVLFVLVVLAAVIVAIRHYVQS